MPAKQLQYTKDEVATLGDAIYARDIRPQVEDEQNKGKFVLIDIETGTWEMDADEMVASSRMETRRSDAPVWMVRVGYPYTYRVGGGRGGVNA
jgi:hypothetical protein